MTDIHPSFKKNLWLIRAALYLNFPLLWIAESMIGGIVLSQLAKNYNFEKFFGLNVIVGYFILLFITVSVYMKIYRGTTFKITSTGVTHNLNFLWNKRKEVLFSNIKEVELKAGFLQKFFGLGTIIVHTQASTTQDNKPGLSLFDVENPEKVYEMLRQSISNANVSPFR